MTDVAVTNRFRRMKVITRVLAAMSAAGMLTLVCTVFTGLSR